LSHQALRTRYRLDWNGLSFVWTGDGKPDQLTAKYAQGCDVFVTEMAVDMVNLWALKQGVGRLQRPGAALRVKESLIELL
jgi:hypothetical protein